VINAQRHRIQWVNPRAESGYKFEEKGEENMRLQVLVEVVEVHLRHTSGE
jgi:hypothetical protein